MKKNTKKLIIVAASVVALLGVILLLVFFLPTGGGDDDVTGATFPTDENGNEYATDSKGNKIPAATDENGKVLSYGAEVLTARDLFDIKTIVVENEGGTLEIAGEATKEMATDAETGEDTELTDSMAYTIVGFEEYEIANTTASAIASSVANMSSTQIIDINGENPKDYGLDSPRATVTAKYGTGDTDTIYVGNEAPASVGTYIMVNDSKTIYLVDTSTVENFFLTINDMLDTNITDAASTEDNAEFKSVTISGAGIGDTINLVPNDDETNEASYKMTSPVTGPVDITEGSNIFGGIRGLMGDSVAAVNPSADKLKELGLSEPHARIKAVYPDVTYELSVSKPDDESNVYIMLSGRDIVYKIASSKVLWAETSLEKLTYSYVLKPVMDYVKTVSITADGKTYSFDLSKKTVTDDEGNETQETVVKCGSAEITSSYFQTFYDKLTFVEREGTLDESRGEELLKVTFKYNNGKADETVTYYKTSSRKVLAVTSSSDDGYVYETYVNDIIEGAKKVANDEQIN